MDPSLLVWFGMRGKIELRKAYWLFDAVSGEAKVGEALDGAFAVYFLDGNEDELMDTLEAVYTSFCAESQVCYFRYCYALPFPYSSQEKV